ncbi:sugar-binding protein [Sorangium sp. So ce887]|uniref:sugar-binding protein n=1 Tax=Sorangium sp. So ce887 TaxID=3133324 RepID=UPI003F5DEA23
MAKQNVSSLVLCFMALSLACGESSSPGAGTDGEASGSAGGDTGGAGGSTPSPGGATAGSGGTSTGGSGASDGSGASGGEGQAGSGEAISPVACEELTDVGSATSISLDGINIQSGNVNGLTFKGFGVLSANSTSELLMDYKSEHPERYAELLKILFGGTRPIITHVKVEMGNDRNNSTGADPATMRLATEAANVRRSPGFQLAADAKGVNPDLKVSILRWNAPGWANNNDKVYTWFKNTILAAYRAYGYMVDYVNPGLNERLPDLTWTKQYAARVKADTAGFNDATEQALYNSIKVMISDEVGVGTFGGSIVSDATLRNAVAATGYHYNTDDDSAGNFKKIAEEIDKEVWNSEAQATFGNTAFRPSNNMKDPTVAGTGIGGINGPLEMGNTIIKGFVKSRRTHFIYQPAIGSFYEGGQYSFKELLSARDPWSGWIHYDAGLDILRHFSWFAKAGWENQDNTAGIWRVVPQSSDTGATGTNPVNGRNGTPSYMTLAAPDKRNFSTIFINDSERAQTYKLRTVNMDYAGNPALELWETRAADPGAAFNSNYMKYRCNMSADAGGIYTIHVDPYSILTATTLANTGDPAHNQPLPVEGARAVLDTDASGSTQNTSDKTLYADKFDYSTRTVPVIGSGGRITGTESYITSRGGPQSVIPRYACDRNGAFEAYLPDGSSDFILRQQVDRPTMGLGGTWNEGNPITGIGDNRWLNYKASVDVSFENNSTQSGNNYAAIGARQQGGGNSHYLNGTPYFLKFLFDGGWQLLVDGVSVASGNVVSGSGGVTINGFNAAHDAWHNIAIQVVENKVTAFLDGVTLATYTDSNPRLSGRIDLASGYYFTRFDNLKVETVDGHAPYYSELLDNLEMNDLASPPAPKLVYGGAWAHENGKSMYNYQRSLSTSRGTGATLEYTFTGTGLDILGPNNGSAKLEVTVDGQVVNPSASTLASKELYQTFSLRGLGHGAHTVQVKVLGGTLVVDAVAVVL